MNLSSILAIGILFVASFVTVFTLLTEKKEDESLSEGLRRFRKPALFAFAFVAFFVGVAQIWRTDHEGQKADKRHSEEHTQDQLKISGLQHSVDTLGQVNNTQYDRNQKQLIGMQDELTKLKIGLLTAEDRKKFAALEGKLDTAIQPKPKAELDFGFFYPNLKQGDIRKTFYVTSNGEAVKIPLMVANVSDVNAQSISIWVRICKECKFHSEPVGSEKAANSYENDRFFHWNELQAGVGNAEIAVDIEVPREFSRISVSLKYRCADCVVEDWHPLWVDVGQIPMPKYSAPSKPPKKPIKP